METINAMFKASLNSSSEESVLPETSQTTSRLRKTSLILGLVIITIIAVASIYAFSQSPSFGVGATELRLDYNVGEKMTYEITVGMQMFDTMVSETVTLEMEVQNFDGENYTVGYTILAGTDETSFTLKLNETGHIVENSELPDDLDETFSYFLGVPAFGSYFTGEKVSVGESWEIPFDFPEIDLKGKMIFVITETSKVNVPAGTYDVLKIGTESSGLSMEAEDVQVNLEINGFLSLEKDTCRLVDLDLNLTLETVLENQTTSIDMDIELTLINHQK
jgi:hypothetical protein